MRSPLLMALSLACILTLTAWKPYAPPEPPTTVSDRAWQATADDGRADVIITARGFPDLSLAQSLSTLSARRKAIVDALIAHADQAQSQLRADLGARGQSYSPLWITNQLLVKNADRATVQWLGARADVVRVDLDEQMKGVERAASGVERRLAPNSTSTPTNPHSIEWGVVRVDAPAVWALGYIGQGIVVANLDTGVRWDHNALKPKYRGWNGSVADHNYNWFDPTALAPAPVDVNGHGTHTVGTSVGDDGAGNQIGVAPGAQWIACRNMATAQGIGSVALYTACFQFALAPTDVAGNNPDSGKGADVTSNSWGCDPDFGEVGCEVPTALITATQVLRDAGVMVVASAGNKGSFCGTVVHAPATLAQTFAVGATDSTNLIASFSSRGPSSLTGQIKPDLVAPGVNVRSATFDTTSSYGSKSGTSMAAPHVAGVVALVWSAAPWLRGDVDATEAILRATLRSLTDATTCFGVPGSSVPNNTYGYGLIDTRAAAATALEIVPTTSAPALAKVGQPITFTVASRNVTSKLLTNVTISSTLPISASLISMFPPGVVNGNFIAWQAPSLAPSAMLTLTFVISAALPGHIASDAQLTFDGAGAPIAGKPAATLMYGHRLITPIIAQGQ